MIHWLHLTRLFYPFLFILPLKSYPAAVSGGDHILLLLLLPLNCRCKGVKGYSIVRVLRIRFAASTRDRVYCPRSIFNLVYTMYYVQGFSWTLNCFALVCKATTNSARYSERRDVVSWPDFDMVHLVDIIDIIVRIAIQHHITRVCAGHQTCKECSAKIVQRTIR